VKHLKLGVLACAVIGLIACFLPYLSMRGESISFFTMREAPGGLTTVYPVMAGFGLAAIMGALAVAKPPMQRWQPIVAAMGFAILLIKARGTTIDLLQHGAVGAKLLVFASIAGVVVSIAAIAKPQTAR
jgi:hypothetical protein